MRPSDHLVSGHIGPDIVRLGKVPQDPKHHPEGDVLCHTLEVIDRARTLLPYIPERNRTIFMLTALLHDIGKYDKTFYRVGTSKNLTHWTEERPENSRIVSYGHDTHGESVSRKWLEARTDDKEILAKVPQLIKGHMKPLLMQEAKLKAFKKLKNKGFDMYTIGILSWADKGERSDRWFDMLERLNNEEC